MEVNKEIYLAKIRFTEWLDVFASEITRIGVSYIAKNLEEGKVFHITPEGKIRSWKSRQPRQIEMTSLACSDIELEHLKNLEWIEKLKEEWLNSILIPEKYLDKI